MSRKPPSDAEIDLFRQAMDDVRPLNTPARTDSATRPPRPEARQRALDDREVMAELLDHELDPTDFESGEELLFLRPGMQTRVLRRLRRGQYSVADEIDLHHMNLEAARRAILEFIEDSRRRGFSCVKIIHGKGLRSKGRGPKIKGLADHLLRRHKAVMAFASARANDGGTGAVYVLLKRST